MRRRWRRHYSDSQIIEEIERLAFPSRFFFGTSTSGYQSEGGFNGTGEPKNNWYYAETEGVVERTGQGARFWDLYPEDLEHAAAMGCNAFRLGIEWARVQPEYDPHARTSPPFDESALEGYAAIIARCRHLGLLPVVTLFHFTHPLWLGLDPWLDADMMIELFTRYVERTVTGINSRLVSYHRVEPISYYITINEPIMVPLACYLLRVHPRGRGRGGRRDFLRSLEHILLAHMAAYERIHRIHREFGWQRPIVTSNTWASYVYPMDTMALDILGASGAGGDREAVYRYLRERRTLFYRIVSPPSSRKGLSLVQRGAEKAVMSLLDLVFGTRPLPRFVQKALSLSEHAPWMDVCAFDYYDPFPADYVAADSFGLVRLKKNPWEWGLVPEALGGFLDSYSSAAPGMPLHIVENGMAYPCRRTETAAGPRPDGADRTEVLKAHLYECLRALNRGVPLQAYFYWTLCDNYEWGSFTPRFGMLGVDYTLGAKRRACDMAGNNTAGAYKALVTAFLQKDKKLLADAFLSRDYPLLFRA